MQQHDCRPFLYSEFGGDRLVSGQVGWDLGITGSVLNDTSATGVYNSAILQQVATAPNNQARSRKITFPVQLHLLLELAASSGQEDIVSWVRNGTAFRVRRHLILLHGLNQKWKPCV